MKNSRRFAWPFGGRTNKNQQGAVSGADKPLSRTRRLTAAAGQAMDAHAVEQLEQRQLLFTLTIGPGSVDPATGVGTASARFAYHMPYLTRQVAEPRDPTTAGTNFDNLTDPWTTFVPPAPPNGTIFPGTAAGGGGGGGGQIGFVISRSGDQTQLIRRGGGGGGQADGALRVSLTASAQVSFSIVNTAADPDQPVGARSATIVISANSFPLPSDGGGLNTDPVAGSRIELLSNGTVVRTLSGAELAAAGQAVVNGTQFTLSVQGGVFDQIRLRSAVEAPGNSTYSDNFVVESIAAVVPAGRFAQLVEGSRHYAEVVFRGPAGATISFEDLYGRDMEEGIGRYIVDNGGGQVPDPGDPDDDGVPNFNIGIGRVIISGSDLRTTMTLVGFNVDQDGTIIYPDGPVGFTDEFHDGGFGYYVLQNTNPPQVLGMPEGVSVVIGSPYVPVIDQFLSGVSPNTFDFSRASQGIFVNGSIGSVSIAGALHGSSRIDGAVNRFQVGFLPGSLRVDGDLGTLTVQTEAGVFTNLNANVTEQGSNILTSSRINVGRTVRAIDIAGRNFATISVLADVNSTSRARLDNRTYVSRERMLDINPATQDGPRVGIEQTLRASFDAQPGLFGTGYFRNDELINAEFIGYNGTSVRVQGRLDGIDPTNSGQDTTDVYSFAADSSREVVVSVEQANFDYVRVVDRRGRVVAALDSGGRGRGRDGNNGFGSQLLRFRPDHADVYYLVLQSRNEGQRQTSRQPYTVQVSGMAPVTFGSYRSGGGTGNTFGNIQTTYGVSLAAGNMGLISVGGGWVNPGGGISTSRAFAPSTVDSDENLLTWGQSSINVAGDLFGVVTGSNISGAQLVVQGNLGTLMSGIAGALGQASTTVGDMFNFDLRVGGSISIIDVNGGMAINQITAAPDNEGGLVNIQTGASPNRKGDIGRILVGTYINGSGISIRTSPGSQIDQFIVGSINRGAGSDFPSQVRGQMPTITMGDGSDLRFMTFSLVQNQASPDVVTIIPYNSSFTFVDDAGASVTISVTGGVTSPDPTQPAISTQSFVAVRTGAVNGSRGSAIARISATLRGGANLNLVGNTPGVVSIGEIIVDADFGGGGGGPQPQETPSNILISGNNQIDVYLIQQVAGALGTISNTTVGGDIVAIDALNLQTVTVNGNLGRTQTTATGQALIGPFLDIDSASTTGTGGPILLSEPALNQGDGNDWLTSAPTYRPVSFTTGFAPGRPALSLEDVGSPIDPFLNGVIVRTGDLVNVTATGSIGDVMAPSGHIIRVTANSDGITPQGGFEGIEGNIYAIAIGTVDIGSGLLGTGQTPFAQASIAAVQTILTIVGGRVTGSTISGIVMAAGVGGALTAIGTVNPTELQTPVDGIGSITLTGGRYDTAFIWGGNLDDWWNSAAFGDPRVRASNIGNINGTQSDLFRSEIGGITLAGITLTGGGWDASVAEFAGNVGTIIADEYRNSTRLGQGNEVYPNFINTSNSITSVTTNGLAGDISDLGIFASGSLLSRIAARNIIRTDVGILNISQEISATNDIRSTTVETGRLVRFTAGQNIRSSSLRVAGPVETVTAGNEITQLNLNSSGPDGRVDLLRAQNLLDAVVLSSGDIGTVESITNDVVGSLTTRNEDVRANNGSLVTVRAGRDVNVGLSILGNVGTVFAQRNVGSRDSSQDLDVRGNLGSLTALNGQLYNDLIVSQAITGTLTIGRVNMLPGSDLVGRANILAFGRINAIVINGDFNADISSRSGGIGSITFNDGSLRPGNSITVQSGDLTQLTFIGGDLLGSVFVDGNIGAIDMLANSRGYASNIGIAQNKRSFRPVVGDSLRNELPPDVAISPGIDGVIIKAGGNIDHVNATGSIFESQIIAGININSLTVARNFQNDNLTFGRTNAVAVGGRLLSFTVNQRASDLNVLAGIVGLGADNRIGGTGADSDQVVSGNINQVRFNSVANNVFVGAGIGANSSGLYQLPGMTSSNGRSTIDSVFAASPTSVSAASAGPLGSLSSGISRLNGNSFPVLEPSLIAGPPTGSEIQLAFGVPFQFVLPSGDQGTITISGPGRAFYDPATGRLRLNQTNGSTNLSIAARGNNLTGLQVLGGTALSLGTLSISGNLRGNSNVFINGAIATLTLGSVDTSGIVGAGGNITSITTGNFLSGTLRGRNVGTLQVNGNFGRSDVAGDAFTDFVSVGSVNVTGAVSGAISAERTIPTITAGSFNGGGIRSAGSIGSVTAATMLNSRISAGGAITTVTISGDVTDSQILGGADLGTDADYGGSGRAADRAFAGSVGTVNVGGNFRKSDVVAGLLRGPSGYFGNDDVVAAGGRGSIGTVRITGTQVGSNLNSEQYRVLSSGTIGTVTVGGQAFTGLNNFRVESRVAIAVNVVITDLIVTEDSRVYTANIIFNQPIDVASLSQALSVLELRNGGAVSIGLAEGSDYTISYDRALNRARIIFSRAVTERNLPQTAGIPGPGVFQFALDASIFRGSTQDSLLDGNGDGVGGDDFARNAIIGDAGDKVTAGSPSSAPNINFYGAADLDLVLRRNAGVGSLADVNTVFTIRGTAGDHPDTDPDVFRIGGDLDVYRISLREGQILRLGQMQGVALAVGRAVYDASGNLIASTQLNQQTGGDAGASLTRVPSNTSTDPSATVEDQYLVKRTGTYFIVVGGSLAGISINDVNQINNADPVPGASGAYNFTISVFDDSNTGFLGDTGSGTGAAIVNPPVPQVFAGTDGVFGTPDDLATFTQGDWVFRLIPGSGGPGSASSVVRGVNSQGWVITRSAAPNGTFGSVNDRIFTDIRSSIGLPGSTGVPSDISPDADIFLLNGGQPIAPGSKFRVVLRLTEKGGDIGLNTAPTDITSLVNALTASTQNNLRGQALIGLFETPAGTGFSNARLVASPSDFLPIGNQPARSLSDGRTAYGYDERGDFFMEFVVPGTLGVANPTPANYALYLQGVIRSDYTLEITQQGTGSQQTVAQNILLETKGGTIDWLEAGRGLTTALAPFSSGVIGFGGTINGTPVDTYILNNLVSNLNAMFTAANVRVNVSTDPSTFARQDFSSVVLAGNLEPSAFFGNGTFGASQSSDMFNTNKNDQAVVFISSLADLGFEPTQAGVDRFTQALTATVARRIGELVGLRLETNITSASTPAPVMGANSPTLATSSSNAFGFTNTDRVLAGQGDNAARTTFYLGNQNSLSLIQRVVLNRT